MTGNWGKLQFGGKAHGQSRKWCKRADGKDGRSRPIRASVRSACRNCQPAPACCSRKCDKAGIRIRAPIMFHRNMKVSRMPMSGLELDRRPGPGHHPGGQRDADQRDHLAGELDRALVGDGQRCTGTLLRQLDAQQVEGVIDTDADPQRDDRQGRHLDTDAERMTISASQRMDVTNQRHDGDHDRAPVAEGNEAEGDDREIDVAQHLGPCLFHDDVGRRLDPGVTGGKQELALRRRSAPRRNGPTRRPRGPAFRPDGRSDRRSPASPNSRC